MRVLGWCLALLGALLVVTALAMDTTVALTHGSGRVHNIGLLNRQNSTLTTGAVLAVIGVLMLLLRRKQDAAEQGASRVCPHCAEEIKAAAMVCRFCGRDVTPVGNMSQEQQMQALGIEYRDGMYWFENQSFYMLSAAMKAAHEQRSAKP